jgi:hypothetical protein
MSRAAIITPSARAARSGAGAAAFIGAYIAIGSVAALSGWKSPPLSAFEACCLIPIVGIAVLELLPAVWRAGDGWGARRRAIRHFRRQLDALPATSVRGTCPR